MKGSGLMNDIKGYYWDFESSYEGPIHSYRGYYFRRTQFRNKDGKRVYQINDEPIDAPRERLQITTINLAKEYIDKRIEEESKPKTLEERVDRLVSLIETISEMKTEDGECKLKLELTIK